MDQGIHILNIRDHTIGHRKGNLNILRCLLIHIKRRISIREQGIPPLDRDHVLLHKIGIVHTIINLYITGSQIDPECIYSHNQ